MIIFYLERSLQKLTISQLTQLIGHSSEEYVAYEANHLIFHPGFNKTRDINIGLIQSDVEDKKDISPHNLIWLNKDFKPSTVKCSTIPAKMKKLVIQFL